MKSARTSGIQTAVLGDTRSEVEPLPESLGDSIVLPPAAQLHKAHTDVTLFPTCRLDAKWPCHAEPASVRPTTRNSRTMPSVSSSDSYEIDPSARPPIYCAAYEMAKAWTTC